MARSGPKGNSNVLKLAVGERRPCREKKELFKQDEGEPVKPKWLTGRAREIWFAKVERYRARGQNVKGSEDSLAEYCALEALLIADYWKKKVMPPASLINARRVYANEFFDTPASQLVQPSNNKPDNRFLKHVR